MASRRHKDELLTAMLELLLSAPRALLRPTVSASWPHAMRWGNLIFNVLAGMQNIATVASASVGLSAHLMS